MWSWNWHERLIQDTRFGLRMLTKAPGFATVTICTLALGIAVSTLMFSTVEGVLLRPLPFRQPQRLVMIWETHPQITQLESSIADFFDLQAQANSFEGIAAYSFKGVENPVLKTSDEPVHLLATDASVKLLSVLGVDPVIGRNFFPAEEQPGHDREVILSNNLWRTRFGADRTIVGQPITLDNQSYTVIGVLPANAPYPPWADVLFPLSHAADRTTRVHHEFEVVGRLKQGVSVATAEAELQTIGRRLQQQYPATNKSIGMKLVGLQEHLVGETRPTLLLLLAAVGLVLLITCINISSLLLARAIARQRESAVRIALGASSRRLLQQFLTENLTISAVGGLAGLGLATVCAPLVRHWLGGQLPRVDNIGINRAVLLFAAGVTLLAGLLLGTIPALQGWRVNIQTALKEGVRDAGRGSASVVRKVLVVTEISLAVIVLVSTGLVVRSFQRLLRGDAGFQAEHVLTMKLKLPLYAYPKPEQTNRFFQDLLSRLKSQPEIQEAGSTNAFPMSNDPDGQSRFLIEGMQHEPGNYPVAHLRFVSPSYFETLRIPFLKGRMFHANDIDENRVIISQSLARRYFSDQSPLGKKVVLGVLNPKPTLYEVVGVVGDVKDTALKSSPAPCIYFPGFWVWETVVVRSTADPATVATIMRREVSAIDKNQPIDHIETMNAVMSDSVARDRISAQLMSVFSLVALFLAALGVYGVMAYMVSHRTREIGIRMALGAQRRDVLRIILSNGILLIVLGLGIGFIGSMLVGRALSRVLFRVTSTDPLTFAAVGLVLLLAAALAMYVPARRAATVDPMIALRAE
jgi:predicted permease